MCCVQKKQLKRTGEQQQPEEQQQQQQQPQSMGYMTVASHENDSHKGSVRGARRFEALFSLFNFGCRCTVFLGLGLLFLSSCVIIS